MFSEIELPLPALNLRPIVLYSVMDLIYLLSSLNLGVRSDSTFTLPGQADDEIFVSEVAQRREREPSVAVDMLFTENYDENRTFGIAEIWKILQISVMLCLFSHY